MRGFTHPLLFPLSNRVREGGQLEEELFASPLSFFKREGKGVSCVRDAKGGGERSEPPALPRLR